MKVILIKDCKDGKVNDIVDVSVGYGSNFLIRNGFGIAYNKDSLKELKQDLENKETEKAKKIAIINELKVKLEKVELIFKLNFSNQKVHGSITNKKIYKALQEKGLYVAKHVVEHVHIHRLGISYIKAHLGHGVEADIKIVVKKDE